MAPAVVCGLAPAGPDDRKTKNPREASLGPAAGDTVPGAEGRNRTGDTGIFSAVLYQLSYLGEPP